VVEETYAPSHCDQDQELLRIFLRFSRRLSFVYWAYADKNADYNRTVYVTLVT